MDYISWRDIRKKGLIWIYFGYGTLAIWLLVSTIQNFFNFENVYSIVWLTALSTYLVVKTIYLLGGEMNDKFNWFNEYINLCEYILFVIGNILFFILYNDTKPGSIESYLTSITLVVDVFTCCTLLLMFIALIYECRGYNIKIKSLLIDIFSFEISVISFVILTGINKCYKTHNENLDRRLLNNYDSTTETTSTSAEEPTNNVIVNVSP